jgi:hypothetical protein
VTEISKLQSCKNCKTTFLNSLPLMVVAVLCFHYGYELKYLTAVVKSVEEKEQIYYSWSSLKVIHECQKSLSE